MKKTLWILILGCALCSSLFGLEFIDDGVGVCLANVGPVDLGWDDTCAFEGDSAFLGEEGDWFVYSDFEGQELEDDLAWWLFLFLGRGYLINGGNIASRFFPLIKEHAGVGAWSGTQAFMGVAYIASMYAKIIEKAEMGDPNVVDGIKGKATIDLGKTAGFYMELMKVALEYVRSARLERRSEVVDAGGVDAVVLLLQREDPWGGVLDDLLVGVDWVAHLTGTSMNVGSLTSKFQKVYELEERGDATEAEMERAWRDVYVYTVKLSGGVVGLGAKLAYSGLGYENYYLRNSAMLLSVLGSGLFFYWDMGGLF